MWHGRLIWNHTGNVNIYDWYQSNGTSVQTAFTISLPDITNVLPHDKTNKMACAPSEDSDQPGHPPSLIREFIVSMKKAWVLSYPLSTQWRLWSDWADAQADQSLCLVHMPLSWFCHEVAQIPNFNIENLTFAFKKDNVCTKLIRLDRSLIKLQALICIN